MSHHLHSLAAHTGSRIDSAAKHNMACKVDSSLYQTWIGAQGMDTERELHQNRMRFAMHKDELEESYVGRFASKTRIGLLVETPMVERPLSIITQPAVSAKAAVKTVTKTLAHRSSV